MYWKNVLVALIEIIKSGEAAEENVRVRVGAIARVKFNGDNEDDNMKLENGTFAELRFAALIIFSCDSSSISRNVGWSICLSVGRSVCLSATSFIVVLCCW